VSGTTRDGFLDGRLTIEQPKDGYRAGADPVLLAAAAAVGPGRTVLELGCGVGTALMCLGWRVPGLALTGLERDTALAELARRNAGTNGIDAEIVTGDVEAVPAELRAHRFDCVMLNPPFFDRRRGTPAEGAREGGRGETEVRLATWLKSASRQLSPRGWLVMIQRIERLPETLAGLDDSLGDVTLHPVAATIERPPERFLLRARKAARGPFSLAPTLVMHGPEGDSPAARAILRDGASLEDAILTNR
jgi:tRNA1(Val) A37 N6-methylase TrmN6